MKRIRIRTLHKINKFWATLLTAIVIIIAGLIFLFKLSTISTIDDFTEYTNEKITGKTEIYKNHFGIPHIVSKSENDLFFAEGFIHASDRLWQMDYMRRTASGNISEIMGADYIESDKFFRCLDLNEISGMVWKNMDKKVRSCLIAYSEGVNFYIKSNKKRLPFEFNALDYIPSDWLPVDCIVIMKLFAFFNSTGLLTDLSLGEIAANIGSQKASELIPVNNLNPPFILEDSIIKKSPVKSKEASKKISSINYLSNRGIQELLAFTNKNLNQIFKISGVSLSSACNGWVTKKVKAPNAGTILANDFHSFLMLPSLWYQIVLSSPTLNVSGVTIPGIPFVFAGRNKSIGWGLTKLMIDDCDIFIEKADSADNDYYFNHLGQRLKFRFRKETIKVKNQGNLMYYSRFTESSPVISGYQLINFPQSLIFKENKKQDLLSKKYFLTFSWTGKQQSEELSSLYEINLSRDWFQFNKSLRNWGSPGMNFLYSDVSGNLGSSPSGFLPIRKNTLHYLPYQGWIPGNRWEGIIRLYDLMKSYNPAKLFTLSANNPPSDKFPINLPAYFEASERAARISELLQGASEYSTRDAQIMQMDLFSNYAKDILGHILPELEKLLPDLTQTEKQAFYRLKKWDFILSPLTAAPAIYSGFLSKLIENTFSDELGGYLLSKYCSTPSLPQLRIIELVRDTLNNNWFDNIRTPAKEYKNYIYLKSLRGAVDYLSKFYNTTDINQWKYGRLHSLTLNHAFSGNPYLRPSVNLGSYELGGDFSTINRNESDLINPLNFISGPSIRLVIDMEDSVIYTNIPGGSSGQALNANYSDQIQLWLNGGYIQIPTTSSPGNGFTLSIVFNPDK